jgi:hypothetical protein
VDFCICLISQYTASGKDEEKYFRVYFDFDNLKETALVIDQTQFWIGWEKVAQGSAEEPLD